MLAIFCYILYFHIVTCAHIVAVGLGADKVNKKEVSPKQAANPVYLWM